ncbi:hypothetical protein ACFL27_28730, partial [candidate division CSSED10-310 bacterium]
MVAYKTLKEFFNMILIICLFVNIASAESEQTNEVKVESLSERTSLILENIESVSFITPLRTFETFLKGLKEGNFNYYLSCFSENHKEAN